MIRFLPSPSSLLVASLTLWAFFPGSGFSQATTASSPLANDDDDCLESFFRCANNDTTCIPKQKICDGISDCPAGGDEINCDDVELTDFWDHMFKKRLSAESDHLRGCAVGEGGDGGDRIGGCVCRGRNVLCGHLRLRDVPADLPRNDSLELLDFEGNTFDHISHDFLINLPTKINILNFAHCDIKSVEERSFYYQQDLEELHLDNNKLETIVAKLFRPGNSLRILSLTYNKISRIQPNAFQHLDNLIELDLRGNRIEKLDHDLLMPLQNLITLYLQHNAISSIARADGINKNNGSSSFPSMRQLRRLSLMGNRIESLDPDCFASLYNLNKLYLDGNKLVHLRNRTFHNITNLIVLTINDSLIESIDWGVFEDVPKLTSLLLSNNQFRMLDKRVLQPLKHLDYIYFDRFEMCESALHVKVCEPKSDGISSREHLLDNQILRISVWVIGAIGCTGNLIVLIGRILSPTNNVVHSLYLLNLALSDLLMGVYLFAIAIVDHELRGIYLHYQYWWRHSPLCHFCGFLGTLSCESSVLILTLVTWDRFVSVTQPLARKQPSAKAAGATLLFLWAVSAGVASAPLIPTMRYFGDEFYGNNGVCLPLHIHEPYAKGWEYSALMFMLVNTLALVFISYAYFRMINEILASGVACRSTRQSRDRDKVAQRFGIIVFTDSMCWVPVITVKIIALSGHPILPDLYAWLAIFILPINSALNPVLYTLTTTVFKKQMRKIVTFCCMLKLLKKSSRGGAEIPQHSASDSGFSLSLGVFPIGGSTRRIVSGYRGTHQSSLNASSSKNSSWKRPTAV